MYPSQFELTALFYSAKIANPAMSDAQLLADVKKKWQSAAKVLRDLNDPREFEMTPTEIAIAETKAAQDEVTFNAEMLLLLEKELSDETAPGGFNRPEIIAELQARIAALSV